MVLIPKILLAVALFDVAGCASMSGVTISDEESRACRDQGCTVWTAEELETLARKFFKDGYRVGVQAYDL